MAVSVFDLFKIGIGPSSSHTVGPMKAARMFTHLLESEGSMASVVRVQSELFGSLGANGKGHGSDTAVLLGLAGSEPDTVDPDEIPALLARIRSERCIRLNGEHAIALDEKADLLFYRNQTLPLHANGMKFTAFDGAVLLSTIYYSVGGGFVVKDRIAADSSLQKVIDPDDTVLPLPLPFHSGDELLELTKRLHCSIAEVMLRNERHWRNDEQIDAGLLKIWNAMQDCVARGSVTQGVLPGFFKVKRRAASLRQALTALPSSALAQDPLHILDWVNLYALAVNEENAAGGRVVTAPTNGAAGSVPAVLHYYTRFVNGASQSGALLRKSYVRMRLAPYPAF